MENLVEEPHVRRGDVKRSTAVICAIVMLVVGLFVGFLIGHVVGYEKGLNEGSDTWKMLYPV